MSDETRNPPEITDPGWYMDNLTFEDREPGPAEVPPRLGEGEDVLVPRSHKIPMRLDAALGEIAARRGPGVTKSDLVREALEALVAADAAEAGQDVLIPLSAALRALSGLPHVPPLPRSA